MKRSWNFHYYLPLAMAAVLGYSPLAAAQQGATNEPAAEVEAEADTETPASSEAPGTAPQPQATDPAAEADADVTPAAPPPLPADDAAPPASADVDVNAEADLDPTTPRATADDRAPVRIDSSRRRAPAADVDVDLNRRRSDVIRDRTPRRDLNRGAVDVDARFSRDLGMRYRAFPEGGFVISDLDNQGITARAGFRPGDRVLRVDNRTVRDWSDFRRVMSGYYGQRVPIYVIREDRTVPVYIDLTEHELPAYLVHTDNPDREQRAGFGVNLTMVDGAVVVSHVYRDSPAALAGVRVGDVIVNANDREVDNVDDVAGYIRTLTPGDDLVLHVRRQGENLRIASRLSTWNLAFDDAHPSELAPLVEPHAIVDPDAHIAALEERIVRLEAAVRGLRKDLRRYEPSTRTELTEPAERDIEIDAPAAPPGSTID